MASTIQVRVDDDLRFDARRHMQGRGKHRGAGRQHCPDADFFPSSSKNDIRKIESLPSKYASLFQLYREKLYFHVVVII